MKKKVQKFCRFNKKLYLCTAFREMLLSVTSKEHAAIAQLVERDLAKVEVAGPSPVCRSSAAAMVELVDTRDLKSLGQKWLCGFESRSRHLF